MRHSAHKVCLESEKRVVRHERVRHKDRLLPANSTCVRQSDITIVNCSGMKEEIWLFARLCTNFTGYVVQSSGWSKTVYIYIYIHIYVRMYSLLNESVVLKRRYIVSLYPLSYCLHHVQAQGLPVPISKGRSQYVLAAGHGSHRCS